MAHSNQNIRFGFWNYRPPSSHNASPDVTEAMRIDPAMFGGPVLDGVMLQKVLYALSHPGSVVGYRGWADHRLRRGRIGSRSFLWRSKEGQAFEAPESLHEYIMVDGLRPSCTNFARFVDNVVYDNIMLGDKDARPASLRAVELQDDHDGQDFLEGMDNIIEHHGLGTEANALRRVEGLLKRARRIVTRARRIAGEHDVELPAWVGSVPTVKVATRRRTRSHRSDDDGEE